MGDTGNGFDKRPQDINRKGAPKKEWTWAGLVRTEGEVEMEGETRNQRVVKAVYKKGEGGDVAAFNALTNRTDGLPKAALDLTSGGEPLQRLLGEISDKKESLSKEDDNKRIGEQPKEQSVEIKQSVLD